MNTPLLAIVILTVGTVYVLFPLALETYIQLRKPREVICPEGDGTAVVRLDARHAAATAMLGATDIRLVDCSMWPGRLNCKRNCQVVH